MKDIHIIFYLPAIRIGFSQRVYTFLEPETTRVFTDVTVIKEDDIRSEQFFSVSVTVSTPASDIRAATLEVRGGVTTGVDYRLTNRDSFTIIPFPPNAQSMVLRFFIIRDDLPEGTEAFQASSQPLEDTPNFQPPLTGTAFQTTQVQIEDDDCKLTS